MNKFNPDDIKGIKIISICVGILLLLVLAPILLRDTKKYDSVTRCPTEIPYNHTVVIVDKTDALSKGQRHSLQVFKEEIQKELQLYERVSIYVLDDTNYMAPVPIFDKCNPGTGDEANSLYQNPKKIQREFVESFGEPLNKSFDKLMEVKQTKHSPILEMINSITTMTDFEQCSQECKLIIVSDMLQNMPKYSQYEDFGHEDLEYEEFSKTQYARGVESPLSGVKVGIMYLLRPGTNDLDVVKEHIEFWQEYFGDNGAILSSVKRIQ